jgi:hypothetical protein
MKSLDYDFRYLDSGIEILEQYLLSDEVFWPVNVSPPEGEPAYPLLTLDGLLLARARLTSRRITPDQLYKVERVYSKLELDRLKWKVAWEEKASKCYQVRARMWRTFIQEYQDNPQENADRYNYEVRLRVMLELLKTEILQPPTVDTGLLKSLDGYLKSILVYTEFIWDEDIQAGFPETDYWFLYGKLPPLSRNNKIIRWNRPDSSWQ